MSGKIGTVPNFRKIGTVPIFLTLFALAGGASAQPMVNVYSSMGEKDLRRLVAEFERLLYQGDPDGALWSPAMVDVPLRNHAWFWCPGDDAKNAASACAVCESIGTVLCK